MKNLIPALLFLLFAWFLSCENAEQEISDLEEGFKNPPESAKPRTWFHAMSGNMSKEGLTKDLEAMSEAGIGGFLLFNITQGIPNGPVKYDSPEHHELLKHAAIEAKRLGLAFGVHNCDGWSSSGGPWVKPEESMKMVVWSEHITSGGTINMELSKPSSREGFYKDIAVIAYPSLTYELDDAVNAPIISTSSPGLDTGIISDGKIDNEIKVTSTGSSNAWVQFSYNKPKAIRSAKIIFNDRHATATLQVSSNGRQYEDVRELFKVRTGKGEWAINDHFDAISSKYFRVKFNQDVTLKEVRLTSNYFINNPLARTAIARTENDKLDPIGAPDPEMVISKDNIKNLTGQMDEKGILNTELPEGKWTIIRFGYTSTSAFNNPASDEGRGLEVDKLSRLHFKKHYDSFVKKVVENVNPVASDAFQYVEIDSYEMGGQNWTESFAETFKEANQYDFIAMLPLVAGRFIESPEASEAVLSDYRKVISDLMTKNYYEYFTELCNADGLKSYIEPYGFGPLNDLDIGGVTDIPMGEFWMNRPITQTASAVSSAHIYGKPIISAESFTSNPTINWKGHPAMAKTSGDLAWTYGINEFMFHRFAHQANIHAEPGMTMNRWGFHFDRTQTWWKNAGKAWFKYIARGSHMLRQGVPVSDMLVYVGEGAPNGAYYRTDFDPEVPKKINFDNVNTDVLLNRIEIKKNKLVLPEGTTYSFLVLRNSKTLSLATMKRLAEILKSGVPVFGDVPEQLAGYHNSEEEKKTFETLVQEIRPMISKTESWETVMKKAGVTPDLEIENGEDVDYVHRKTMDEDIYFFYNADSVDAKDFEVRFRIANKIPELWKPMDGTITKMASFKSVGEITKATIGLDAGESVFVVFRTKVEDTEKVSEEVGKVDFELSKDHELMAKVHRNGKYSVPLSSGKTWNISALDIPEPLEIAGNWDVSFDKKGGFGETVKFDSLVDWSLHPKDSIKYYSGTAVYRKVFELTNDQIRPDTNVVLDLGEVFIVADVKLNGNDIAVSWMAPFQVDISNYVKEGENTLEIAITNQWSNRLIGDERYPANDGEYKLGPHRATELTMPDWYTNNEPRPEGPRTTFTTAPFYSKDDSLMPSGLMGPVQLKFAKVVTHNPELIMK